MNARSLQQAIIDDLEKTFSKIYFKAPGHKMKSVRAYRQELPFFNAQNEDDFFPYIIVRLIGGGVETPTSPHKVDALLLIGIFDDGTEEYRPGSGKADGIDSLTPEGWDNRNFGAMAVLELIEKIQAHYERQPSLENGDFYFDGAFHWIMQDESSYPYYFGACELSFTLAAPRKEVSIYT